MLKLSDSIALLCPPIANAIGSFFLLLMIVLVTNSSVSSTLLIAIRIAFSLSLSLPLSFKSLLLLVWLNTALKPSMSTFASTPLYAFPFPFRPFSSLTSFVQNVLLTFVGATSFSLNMAWPLIQMLAMFTKVNDREMRPPRAQNCASWSSESIATLPKPTSSA